MAETNLQDLDINFVDTLEEQEECTLPPISQIFLDSPWYADILYVLTYLNAPLTLSKKKARFLKQKSLKFCILDGFLYWKNPTGMLLKCLLESDAEKIMHEMHEGKCGGHIYQKTTAKKKNP